jgi:carbamoyltransferase
MPCKGGQKKSAVGFRVAWNSGSRRLGTRSIICDARSEEMQSLMNLRIQCRESFRLFAPTTLIGH